MKLADRLRKLTDDQLERLWNLSVAFAAHPEDEAPAMYFLGLAGKEAIDLELTRRRAKRPAVKGVVQCT